jgi:hypothetical protein
MVLLQRYRFTDITPKPHANISSGCFHLDRIDTPASARLATVHPDRMAFVIFAIGLK